MEAAKIAIFEDDLIWQTVLAGLLEHAGHKVIATATNMEQARFVIQNLEVRPIDVAIVDDNLGTATEEGVDGATIAKTIHQKFSSVVIIGFSENTYIDGADISLFKTGDPGEELPAAITRL